MRYPATEKLEVIRLVERSHLSVRRTLAKLGIPPTTFYRWYDRFAERGPVGIGKTFALHQIADELTKGEDRVYLIEAPSDKSENRQEFFQKLLFDFGFSGLGGSDAFEVFKGYMLRSYPFRQVGGRPRILLVINECQRLSPKILEALRGAYDGGQWARDFNSDAPAFGILLVGNHHFLTKGGHSAMATFDALLSRCPLNIDLGRPDESEYAA